MSSVKACLRGSLLALAAVATPSADAKAAAPTVIARQVAEPSSASPVDEPCHGDAAGTAWWTGFNDTALNLLHALASARTGAPGQRAATDARAIGCAQAELTIAYVQLRVLALRRMIAQSILETAARQEALLKSQSALPDASLSVLAARVDRTQAQLRELEMQRLHFVEVLGLRTGLVEERLTTALAPALSENNVPRFQMAIPMRLPAALLRGRSDMAELERQLLLDAKRSPAAERRLAAHNRSLGGWIAAEGIDNPGADEPAGAHVQADRAGQLRSEVARDLRALIDRGNAAAMLGQLVVSRRVEFEATRQRQQLGQAGELEASERYYALLLDTDRLAAVNGEMALAWIRLQRRVGGALQTGAEGQAHAESGMR
jgi:hypothetical protein